jgi:hypothetical protein
MPTGISQDQVNAAADQLVAAGNKPTVEKVRQVLGTGSPNTITRMLEAWRGELAQRMAPDDFTSRCPWTRRRSLHRSVATRYRACASGGE